MHDAPHPHLSCHTFWTSFYCMIHGSTTTATIILLKGQPADLCDQSYAMPSSP